MKTLYLECGMGAAGDMLMAALLELIPDRQKFIDKMNSLGIPGVEVSCEKTQKCGITGSHVHVTVHGEEEHSHDDHDHGHDHEHEHAHAHMHEHVDENGNHYFHSHDSEHSHAHEHHHEHTHSDEAAHSHEHHHHHGASMGEISHLIDHMDLGPAGEHAKAVYALIAQAEAAVHDRPVDQIHFHELGTMDALADILGVCLLMEEIGADRIVASPVHVGSGYVKCAHGVLPVPAPATARILNGVPAYGGSIRGELCTPTGAALLKHFAHEFGERPLMSTDAIGYGMGNKDFERANCVRAFLGTSTAQRQTMVLLETNLDDMTPEAIAFAMERLFEAGARDVYTTPIGMKKSRPGIMLSCLCLAQDSDKLAEVMMKHTSTLGIRRLECSRHELQRSMRMVDTAYGPVHVKEVSGMGVSRAKAEYQDLAEAAVKNDVSLETVRREAEKNF